MTGSGSGDGSGSDDGSHGDESPDDLREALAVRERELDGWIDDLRERRDRLAELDGELADLEGETIPGSVADSLSELAASLRADLDAQIDALAGDVEAVRELRDALDRTAGTAAADELATYAERLDGVLAEKCETADRLVATTDELVDRFERVLDGREG